jgi:hypothetical protein
MRELKKHLPSKALMEEIHWDREEETEGTGFASV